MKRILLSTMLGLSLVGTVYAQPMPAELGTYEFNLEEIYDYGRLYSYDSGTGNYTPTNLNPRPYMPGDTGAGVVISANTTGNAGTHEDTWGVLNTTYVRNLNTGNFLFNRFIPGNGEISGVFWGFSDDLISSPNSANQSTILSSGGRVQFWYDPTPDYDASTRGTAGRNNPANPGQYATVNDPIIDPDAILLLDLIPHGRDADGHTLKSGFNFGSNAGEFDIYLDTTGLGLWDAAFNWDTQLFGSDFILSGTARDNSGPVLGDWIVRGDGRMEGATTVPEPSTFILLGMGLLGSLYGVRRFGKK